MEGNGQVDAFLCCFDEKQRDFLKMGLLNYALQYNLLIMPLMSPLFFIIIFSLRRFILT